MATAALASAVVRQRIGEADVASATIEAVAK
jgi:hypothetical protein